MDEAAPRTVGEALAIARRVLTPLSETPALDGQLLVAEALACDRVRVLAHPDQSLEPSRVEWLLDALRRCREGEALPHVLGWWEFYGRRFRLSSEVLIPRPETELLVEGALAYLAANPTRCLAADIGTGSGCIAVSIAAESTSLLVVASDLSREPLRVARSNAIQHGVVDRIALVQCDLIPPASVRFDLVCANLPYVPSAEVERSMVGRREPRVALDGGVDGLELIRRLLAGLPDVLAPGGQALIEIEADRGEAAMAEARRILPGCRVGLRKDLAGRDRMMVIDVPRGGDGADGSPACR